MLRVEVDDAQAQRYGLTRAQVARALNTTSLGLVVEQYRQERDPIALVLRSPEGMAQSLERLKSVSVFNSEGQGVPLTALARIEPQ